MSILERLEATKPYQWLRYQMNKGLVAFLAANVLEGKKDLRIAELACGSGAASHMIALHPAVKLSLAGDINMVDFRQAGLKEFRAKFVLMDLFRPAAAEGSFDLVWNSSSVEEFPDPPNAVRSMVHLAKPGGYVFVGVPYKYGPAGWLKVIPSSKMKAWLGRTYSRKALATLLTDSGLTVEKQVTYLGTTFVGALGKKPF
jgi:SAM-dependent methyltransferase